MVTNYPNITQNPNILEIHHGLSHMKLQMFDKMKENTGGMAQFQDFLPEMARDLYKVPSVKQLYEKRKEFDLIIVNHMFNEVSVSPSDTTCKQLPQSRCQAPRTNTATLISVLSPDRVSFRARGSLHHSFYNRDGPPSECRFRQRPQPILRP